MKLTDSAIKCLGGLRLGHFFFGSEDDGHEATP